MSIYKLCITSHLSLLTLFAGQPTARFAHRWLPLNSNVSQINEKHNITTFHCSIHATIICAGAAGEVISLNCSNAIASTYKYIERKNIKININSKTGEIICITPNEKEIYIRYQSPSLKATDSKYLFTVNANNYKVINLHFGR